MKPLFANKNPMSEKITLTEDGRILSNDVEVTECFDKYFCNITVEQMVLSLQTMEWLQTKKIPTHVPWLERAETTSTKHQ